jgi:GNAT superfamily N-acetyltransferase
MEVEIREMRRDALDEVARLLAVGMLHNPLHDAVFGDGAARRQARLLRFIRPLVGYVEANGTLLGACAGGELVGVLGVMKPGRCRVGAFAFSNGTEGIKSQFDSLRLISLLGRQPPGVALRMAAWMMRWRRNDPSEPHWHLGPMAVRPAFRRRGIARRLMTRVCARIDASRGVAFLETDLPANAAFYESLGFVVVRHEPVLGVPNWFMRRPPSSRSDVWPGRPPDSSRDSASATMHA